MNDFVSISLAVLGWGGAVVSVTGAIVGNRSRTDSIEKQEAKQEANQDSLAKERAAVLQKQGAEIRVDFEALRAGLMRDIDGVRADIKGSTVELHEAITMFKVLAAEINVVNRVTSQTLASMQNRVEEHEKRLGQVEGSVNLLNEFLHAKGILG